MALGTMEEVALDQSAAPVTLAVDNIAIEQPVARLGTRALAAFLDYIFLSLVEVGALVLTGIGVAASGIGDEVSPGLGVAAWIVLAFGIEWGYFTISEIVGEGRTAGKAIVGLRVVSESGAAASTRSYLLRNMIRLPDILVGAFLLALDPKARRLGDRFAGTMVIHDRSPGPTTTLTYVPKGWGSREVLVAETFLRRAEDMEMTQRLVLARRLIAIGERQDPDFFERARRISDDPVEILRLGLGAP